MIPDTRLENAVRASPPAPALRTLVRDLFHEGHSRDEIHALLESFVLQLRTRRDCQEADEEMVLDLMDALTGWCHPEAQLSAED